MTFTLVVMTFAFSLHLFSFSPLFAEGSDVWYYEDEIYLWIEETLTCISIEEYKEQYDCNSEENCSIPEDILLCDDVCDDTLSDTCTSPDPVCDWEDSDYGECLWEDVSEEEEDTEEENVDDDNLEDTGSDIVDNDTSDNGNNNEDSNDTDNSENQSDTPGMTFPWSWGGWWSPSFNHSDGQSIYALEKHTARVNYQKDYFLERKYQQRTYKGKVFMVNNKDLDMSTLDGTLHVPLIIESANTIDNQKASVVFDEDTTLRKENGSLFTGVLSAPTLLDTDIAYSLSWQDIVSIVDVWWNSDRIVLEDPLWEPIASTIRVPTPWRSWGDTVVIYYSQDGGDWNFMDTQTVFIENGSAFVEFQTTHFTLFAVGIPVWFFMINGDDISTDTTDVTLSLYVYGATQMRFSNTNAWLASAQRVSYTTEYNRTLEDRDWDQKVYAEFTGLLWLQTMQDTIFVNRVDSDLVLHVGWTADGDTILDSTSNNFHLTAINNIRNRIIDWYPTLLFDGSANQYAQRWSIGITDFPFTLAARVKVENLSTSRSIIAIWDSSTDRVHWAIQLFNGEPSIVWRNETLRRYTAWGVQNIGDRVHIVWVFIDTNTRHLYVNGQYMGASQGSADFTDTNQQVRIGRYPGPSAGYFLWGISDARIYTKELSAQEIANLHAYRETVGDTINEVNVWTFYINNGAPTTYSTGVTLSIDASHVTQMKFSNTEVWLDTADWVAYATGYDWTLDNTPGNKTVYAAFSGAWGVVYAQDNIFYDDPDANNSLLLVDGSMDGDTVLDRTSNNYHLTQYNGITNPILGVEEILFFSAGNQYAERWSIGITNYPFTLAAWVRVENQSSTRAIVSIWDDSSNVRYWHIGLLNGQPVIQARNGAGVRSMSAWGVQNIGDRVHVVWVFNASNDRRLYVNGDLVGTQVGGMTFNGINQQVRIGRLPGTAAGYFIWSIDDARIYSKSLDDQEIGDLYQNYLDRQVFPTATVEYDTTTTTTDPVTATLTGYSESITILNNGWDDTYTFTGNGTFTFFFQNSGGNVWSATASVHRITTPSSGSLSLSWPNNLSFGEVTVSDTVQELELAFTWSNEYFVVEDTIGSDDGYYTTIDVSSLQYNVHTITNTDILVKTIWWTHTLAGNTNSSVVSALWWSYVTANWPITFIKRDPWSNNWLIWSYGAHLGIKIDIPGLQQPWNYTGTITYTIY